MNLKIALCLIMTVYAINLVSATFISGDIYVDDYGVSTFQLKTDVDPNVTNIYFDASEKSAVGTSESFTSKVGGVWTFSLELGNYDSILLDVHLPKNVETINSIQGVDKLIDFNRKIISLIDGNRSLDFSVTYSISKSENYFVWIVGVILFIMLAFMSIYFYIKNNKKKNRMDYILPIINDNEKRIVELLMKRPLRQKEVRKILDMPKASFSRYIINLENKKLIVREGEGKNKILKLK